MKLKRKIIHIDMDAFYASVEQRDFPELRGRPIIVGGSAEHRGVVTSASYEARKFGVRSAMSSFKASQLCPQGIFVPVRMEKYREVSEKIRAIFLSVTPLVEPLSLDEAYLDVTENLLNEPLARNIAIHIRNRIKNELFLTASAGVGPNKFIAKVASDIKKPDGLVVIPPEKVREFVDPLPIEKLWGVGPATAKRLHEIGIFKAKDLQETPLPILEKVLGSYANFLQGLAYGRDDREVEPNRETKSIGTENTFDKDVLDSRFLVDYLETLAQELSESIKEEGRPVRTITLKVKYSDFTSITRSRTLSRYTRETSRIAKTAADLLLNATEAGKRPIRLLGVSVSGFMDLNEPEQLDLDLGDLD